MHPELPFADQAPTRRPWPPTSPSLEEITCVHRGTHPPTPPITMPQPRTVRQPRPFSPCRDPHHATRVNLVSLTGQVHLRERLYSVTFETVSASFTTSTTQGFVAPKSPSQGSYDSLDIIACRCDLVMPRACCAAAVCSRESRLWWKCSQPSSCCCHCPFIVEFPLPRMSRNHPPSMRSYYVLIREKPGLASSAYLQGPL